eukprot:scaffold6607_cov73-Cylindrotheca_fusiformis.AAC.3
MTPAVPHKSPDSQKTTALKETVKAITELVDKEKTNKDLSDRGRHEQPLISTGPANKEREDEAHIGEKFLAILVVSGSFLHAETYAERMDRAKSAQSALPSEHTQKTCCPICAVDEWALPLRNRPCL